MKKLIDVGKMDNYYEQGVKKRMSNTTSTAIILSIILLIIGAAFGVYISFAVPIVVPFSVIMFGGAIYLIYYMIKNSGIEYEYTFVQGEMRVEKIKGNSRKKITTFDVKAIDDIDRYVNPETGEKNIDTAKFKPNILKAAETENDKNTYYVVIHDQVREKHAILLFTPDEVTLEKIKPYLSIELKKKFILMQKKYAEIQKKEAVQA